MAEPAPKRRRTSPPEDADVDRASSPLKQPPRRPERSSSPLKQPPRRLSFASYASPTKASLSRYNPNLLPRPRTADRASPRRDIRRDITAQGNQARAFILEDTEEGAQDEDSLGSDDGAEATADPQVERTLEAQNTTPRRKGRTRGAASRQLGDVDEEEEGLPTTPSASQDTERRGILFSSPSKRPPRQKDSVKPSPLKKRVLQELPNARNTLLRSGKNDAGDALKEKTKEPFNPELEKRKHEKARLERELQEMEKDVDRCVQEMRRGQQSSGPLVLPGPQFDDLLSFINKIGGSDDAEDMAPAVSRLMCSFLPFKTKSISQYQPKDQERPIPSHHPLELDDPLPYLQMFTSFKFKAHVTIPDAESFDASSANVYQQHTIDVEGPQKLLTGSVVATIDTKEARIIDLNIQSLSPWAERELGTFMRKKAGTMDLGTSTWAMQSYWEVAKRRAEHWNKCEKAFGDLAVVPGCPADEDITHSSTQKRDAPITRKELRRHLGRDSFTLQDSYILLKFRWKIGFDWTGEAESEVYVEPALPRVWTEADSQNHFSKIPRTFDGLLRTRGVFEATKILVDLLFNAEE